MLDAIDTYFSYCQSRLTTINPARKVVGVMDAADWPADPVIAEGFYLLTLGQRPAGKEFWSKAVPAYAHTLQWTWLIQGSDLTKGKAGRSRGDRYRTAMTMKEELVKASWPWYTEKLHYTVQGNTPSGLAVVASSLNPKEFIWFSDLVFMQRIDRSSGTLYGTATVYLTDMEAAISA